MQLKLGFQFTSNIKCIFLLEIRGNYPQILDNAWVIYHIKCFSCNNLQKPPLNLCSPKNQKTTRFKKNRPIGDFLFQFELFKVDLVTILKNLEPFSVKMNKQYHRKISINVLSSKPIHFIYSCIKRKTQKPT